MGRPNLGLIKRFAKEHEDDQLFWLAERAEQADRYEQAINRAILQADELHSNETNEDVALGDIFRTLKESLNK